MSDMGRGTTERRPLSGALGIAAAVALCLALATAAHAGEESTDGAEALRRAEAEARQLIDAGQPWQAAETLHRVTERDQPDAGTAEPDAIAREATRQGARLLLADTLHALGFVELALKDYADVVGREDADGETRTRAMQRLLRVVNTLPERLQEDYLPTIAEHGASIGASGDEAALLAFARIELASVTEVEALIGGIPSASRYAARARLAAAKRLVYRGISDGVTDDFSASPLASDPDMLDKGLALLAGFDWPERLRPVVADLLVQGHVYQRRLDDAVSALESLVAQGDPDGRLRVRLSVARSLDKPCLKSTRGCSEDATGHSIDLLAALAYAGLCEQGASAATVAAARVRAIAFNDWLRAQPAVEEGSVENLLARWESPTDAGSLAPVIRALLLEADGVVTARERAQRWKAAGERLRSLPEAQRRSPFGEALAGRVELYRALDRDLLARAVEDVLVRYHHALEDVLLGRPATFWKGLSSSGLELDPGVCAVRARRGARGPAASAPVSAAPVKPCQRGGCAGCTSGREHGSATMLFAAAVLLACGPRRRRRRRPTCTSTGTARRSASASASSASRSSNAGGRTASRPQREPRTVP